MGFMSKAKNSSGEGWGMGIFLIFFSDEDHQSSPNNRKSTNFNPFSLPSSLKRTNSANLLFKAQSTISICALLLFTTLLLFTVSTLPSNSTSSASAGVRRSFNLPRRKLDGISAPALNSSPPPPALQGMGSLYRRGTRATSALVVAHVVESLTSHEFKLFLRLLYRSSITSRSDVLFVFPSKSPVFDRAIKDENDSFMKLLNQYIINAIQFQPNNSQSSFPSFDATHFVRKSNKSKEIGEPIWGRKIRSSNSNFSQGNETEATQLSYGSVVGFDADELDPENSLSGFLDHVPMNLRRWACYPMLLGRVRRNFKHLTLVDVKEMLLLDDPLDKSTTATTESVFLVTQSAAVTGNKHGKKNPEKSHDSTRQKPVTPAIIAGGARGVRRLSNLMLTEIVRASMQKKKKGAVAEQFLFNQLVGNRFVLKDLELFVSPESVPEFGSLIGSGFKTGLAIYRSKQRFVMRGNSNLNVNSIFMKHLCSFPIDSTVYNECY